VKTTDKQINPVDGLAPRDQSDRQKHHVTLCLRSPKSSAAIRARCGDGSESE